MLVLLNDDATGIRVQTAGPVTRLLVRLRRPRLDRELARGVSPDTRPALAIRAGDLLRSSAREDFASGLRHALAIATSAPSALRRPAVPLCRDRVRAAAPELRELADRLVTPGPVATPGMARVSLLLTQGTGPLYRRDDAYDLRTELRRALEALEPGLEPV
jgi:hypothetical protein